MTDILPANPLLSPSKTTVPPPNTAKEIEPVAPTTTEMLSGIVKVVPELGDNVPDPVPTAMGTPAAEKLAVAARVPPPSSVNVLGDPKLAALATDNVEALETVNPPTKEEVLVPLKATVPPPEIVKVSPEGTVTLLGTVNVITELGENVPPPVPTLIGTLPIEKLAVAARVPPPSSVKELGAPNSPELPTDNVEESFTRSAPVSVLLLFPVKTVVPPPVIVNVSIDGTVMLPAIVNVPDATLTVESSFVPEPLKVNVAPFDPKTVPVKEVVKVLAVVMV